jgi:hypothetical protein
MKQSTIWLLVGVGATVLALIVGAAMFAGSLVTGLGSSGPNVATASVNMEKLTEEFERAFKGSDKKDVKAFEAVVNDKSKGIYKGDEKATVVMEKSGEVVGFVDKNANGGYDLSSDDKLFSLQADKAKEEVVATDNHNRHYRHRPSSGFFTGMLVGNMLSRQRGYYGGRYWTAPRTNYVRPGYYSKLRSQPTGVSSSSRSRSRSRSSSWGSTRRRSSSSSSKSSKSSSWGSSNRSSSWGRSRSGSRSGGFSFGK